MAWLDSVGFKVERGRISQYKKTIERIHQSWDDDKWGDLNDNENRQEVTNILLEARELTSIYRGFSTQEKPEIDKNLKHYLKGPYLVTDEKAENASNRPRNLGFELYLNALFARAGLGLLYDTSADLSFVHDGITYHLEAKRPQYLNSVENNIIECNRQLTKRLNNSISKKGKGLIALDLSRVMNPTNDLFISPNKRDLELYMTAESEKRIAEFTGIWNKKRHKRTVAVLLHFKLLTLLQPRGDLVTVKWISTIHSRKDANFNEVESMLNAVIGEIC